MYFNFNKKKLQTLFLLVTIHFIEKKTFYLGTRFNEKLDLTNNADKQNVRYFEKPLYNNFGVAA